MAHIYMFSHVERCIELKAPKIMKWKEFLKQVLIEVAQKRKRIIIAYSIRYLLVKTPFPFGYAMPMPFQ